MDLGKKLQVSLNIYFKNFGTLFSAGLVAWLLSALTLGILSGPLLGGFLILNLKIIRGKGGNFKEIFAHFDKFAPTLVISVIVFALTMAIGIIPFLGIPISLAVSPFIGLAASFALITVMEKNSEPIAALKESIAIIKTDPAMFWVYGIVMGILSGVGAIVFLVGIIITLPLAPIGMAVAYNELPNN